MPRKNPNAQCSAVVGEKLCENLVGVRGRGGKCDSCYKKELQRRRNLKCKAKGHFEGADWECSKLATIDSLTGYCDGHRSQHRRGLSIRPLQWDARRCQMDKVCNVRVGDWKCGNQAAVNGMCSLHYGQNRHSGRFGIVKQYKEKKVEPVDAEKVAEIKALEGEQFTAWVKERIKTAMVTGDFDPTQMKEWKDHIDREEGKAASRSVVRTIKEIPFVEIKVMALDPDATLDHIVPADD